MHIDAESLLILMLVAILILMSAFVFKNMRREHTERINVRRPKRGNL